MSPTDIVLYPLACAFVFVVVYSLVMKRLQIWPFVLAVPSIITGLMTGSEHLSVYVYVGVMFAFRGLASLGSAALDRAATRQMEEPK